MSLSYAMKLLLIGLFSLAACDLGDDAQRDIAAAKRLAYEGPCSDTSWLLATTTGSPSTATCPNKAQHMRVQIASAPSNEEFGAVVFCECQRDGIDGGTP